MRRLGRLAVFCLAALASSAALAAPPTLDHPGEKTRFISLAEARAIALEYVPPVQPSLLFPGIGLDSMITAPGSSPPPGPDSFRVLAGGKRGSKSIVITVIRRNPRPAEFERNVNQHLLNIECAYWNLCGSYWQLYSREQALRFAYETWKIAQAKHKAGNINSVTVAQAEGQYNLFRSQRLQALDTVLDNERQLRAMLGLPIKDGTRLVPSDPPTLVEKKPDWKAGCDTAMKNRPELDMARQDVKIAQRNVQLARTDDLRRYLAHDSISIGSLLDGKGPLIAYRNLAPITYNDTYNDWNTSVPLRMPLGLRFASSQLHQSQLQLARAYLVLSDQELKAERFLGLYYRRMSSAYSQIKAARAQREAFAKQLQIRYELYRVGANDPATQEGMSLSLLLESQRFWAEALATEYQAICTYNNSLAGWEYAKGDIMKHAHIRLVEEASSGSDAVRAVEREHKRTRQHVRREAAMTANSPLTAPDACSNGEIVKAPSLVALWKGFPPLKEAGEALSSDGEDPLVAWNKSDIFSTYRRQKTN